VFRVWGNLRAVCWKDKWVVYDFSDMSIPPVKGNFKEDGKTVKPLIIEVYTTHMGYVGLSDRMAGSYSISKKTRTWTKNCYLLDLTILNSYILYKSCKENMTHLKLGSSLLWILSFSSSKRILKSMVCQGVDPAVRRLKLADLK
jgi:hypothetical protein